jgi:hypothetical protein
LLLGWVDVARPNIAMAHRWGLIVQINRIKQLRHPGKDFVFIEKVPKQRSFKSPAGPFDKTKPDIRGFGW